MKTKLLILAMFVTSLSFSQDVMNQWQPSATVSLNASQTQFSNWSKGGENNLSWTFNFEAKLDYQNEKLNFTNLLKTSFGKSKIGNAENKTMQNDLLFNNKLSYKSGWLFNYYAGINLITQNAPGYNYATTPAVQVSDLFDPADLTESVGLIYEPNKIFTTQLGFGFHQVFAKDYTNKSDDTETTEVETFKSETGIESISKLNLAVAENITYSSFLRLFSAFDRIDTWDVRWDNTISAKVNNWLNVNFTYLLVYDVAETLKTQTKQALEVGISYKLL